MDGPELDIDAQCGSIVGGAEGRKDVLAVSHDIQIREVGQESVKDADNVL
jgi:hypothetical protein